MICKIYLVIPVSMVSGIGKVALEWIILRHTLNGQNKIARDCTLRLMPTLLLRRASTREFETQSFLPPTLAWSKKFLT